jgi:hypothetical protein
LRTRESSGVCGKTRDLNRFTTAISTWDNWTKLEITVVWSGSGNMDRLMRAKDRIKGFLPNLGYFQQKHEMVTWQFY